jgi:ABC-type transport system involved in multi-copper enzyme maturation permease subunit
MVVGRIVSLARLVFIDGVKRRALVGLVLLALLLELGGLFLFGFVPRDVGRVLVDYVVTIGWAAGMIFLLFHAVQVMGWGEDRRVIQLLLSQPLSRSEYVVGVFCGLFFLLLSLNSILAVIGYAILFVVKSSVPDFFQYFGLVEYLLSWSGVVAIELFVLAAVVVFSGLVRGGFGVLILTLAYYLISNGLPVALEFFKKDAGIVKTLLVALTLVFPNYDRWDFKGTVVVMGTVPPWSSLAFDFLYVVVYCAVALILSAKIYSLRDIQ